VASRDDVRATLRTLLVHRRDDLAPFEAAFELFFRPPRAAAPGVRRFRSGEGPLVVARPSPGTRATLDEVTSPADRGTAADVRLAVGAYTAAEISRTKDFARFTDEELARAQAILKDLPWRLGVRRTRRWEAERGCAIDVRRVARGNVTRGETLKLPRRRRRETARPIVVLGDVSGSMERYSRVLLHFVHGLARGGRHVESFVFATRLTRITHDPFQPLPDWGGGTRIGDALRSFNVHWARRVMRHGPVVLLVSDGWDRGDPALISRELARLRRSCRRLIWLNPLLGSASYQPLTRGMQAALPHVDDFLPAHNLASLEDLARHLRALPPRHAPRRHVHV
jgi:uncharacterized protein with von Willebrand factor type A (vWA) domain